MSGSGIQGVANIGVIKAFEEEKIKIKYIAGASAGSVVATLYALGYSHEEMYDVFKKYGNKLGYWDFKNILRGVKELILKGKLEINGFKSGENLEKTMNELSHRKGIHSIKQIKMPLILQSINLHTGGVYCFSSREGRKNVSEKIVYIKEASVGKAVRASCSYPIIFSPCKFNNLELVDGGLRENILWKEVRAMGAEKVIRVKFGQELSDKNHGSMVSVINSSLETLKNEVLKCEEEDADYVIKINTKRIDLLDTKRIDELYQSGYEATKKDIVHIKKMMKEN